MSATATTKPRSYEDAREIGPRRRSWSRQALQRAREGRRAFAVAEHRRDASVGGQIRAAIDCRDREVELGTFGATGEHDANRMEQGFTLLTRSPLHAVRDLPKFFAVEARRRRELLRERHYHGARRRRLHLGPGLGVAQRARGVVVEQKRKPARHLVQ